MGERREVLRVVHPDILRFLPLQRPVLFGARHLIYVAVRYLAVSGSPWDGGPTLVALLYGNTSVPGAPEDVLVGRAGVPEGGRVVVPSYGRLRRAVARVGLGEVVELPGGRNAFSAAGSQRSRPC